MATSPPEDRAAVDAHIDACGPCRGDLDAQRAARELLLARRTAIREAAPAALRARCAATARPQLHAPAVQSRTRLIRRLPLAAAATILLALAAVVRFWTQQQGPGAGIPDDDRSREMRAFQQLCNGGRPGSGRRAVDVEVRLAAQRAGLFATGGAGTSSRTALRRHRWPGRASDLRLARRAALGLCAAVESDRQHRSARSGSAMTA